MARTKEALVSGEELAKEIFLQLYRAITPQSPEEVAEVLWRKHRSPVFTQPTIQNELEFLS